MLGSSTTTEGLSDHLTQISKKIVDEEDERKFLRFIDQCRRGQYHDSKSPLERPKLALIESLLTWKKGCPEVALELEALLQRVFEGEFDENPW